MSERVLIGPVKGQAFILDAFEKGNYALVPAEERAAVALALLGGMTDEMIERCAKEMSVWGDPSGVGWERLPEGSRSFWRVNARLVLCEAFGIEP